MGMGRVKDGEGRGRKGRKGEEERVRGYRSNEGKGGRRKGRGKSVKIKEKGRK